MNALWKYPLIIATVPILGAALQQEIPKVVNVVCTELTNKIPVLINNAPQIFESMARIMGVA